MNKAMLKSKMVLHGDTQSDLAAYLGISLSHLNDKINQKRSVDFRRNEIVKIARRYNLTAEDVESIFFASQVS